MGRQQLVEERLARHLGPTHEMHALVEVLHQHRQLHQELLAQDRRALRLHAHHQIAGCTLVTPGTVGIGSLAAHRHHDGLRPYLRQEVAQIGLHWQRLKGRLQLQHVTLLQAQLRLLAFQRRGGAVLVSLGVGLLGDEAFEHIEFLGVQLDLIEIAFDDVLHHVADALQHLLARSILEIVEGTGQRSDAVDEAAHRVASRREKAGIVECDPQHRQLQARDLAGHLRRHSVVRQDLVEQAAHHVDHHVVELADRCVHQLLAVRAYQVHRHHRWQPCILKADIRRSRTAVGRGAILWFGSRCRAACSSGLVCAVRKVAVPAGHRRQPPEQLHQLQVGLRRSSCQTGIEPALSTGAGALAGAEWRLQ